MKQIIKNARIIDPANKRDKISNVYIANGKLVDLVADKSDFFADEVIEASGKVVMPGAIDLYTTMMEPGFDYKATIASETKAAMQAGVTTLCCAPTTKPIIDTSAVVELINARVQQANAANILVYGALTKGLQSQTLANMASLKEAGCVAMTNAHFPIADTTLLRHSFEYAATFDLLIIVMPQDAYLAKNGLVHEGRVNARTGVLGIPRIAESIEVARTIAMAEFTKTKIHFSQITTAESVALIAAAKAKGLPVTADVSINHLFLSEVDASEFDTNCLVQPPLRTFQDQQALLKGLQEGVIDAICSAHTPQNQDAKQCPFSEAEPGISNIEILLSLSFRLVLQGKLTMSQWIACLTANPACIVQPQLGQLQIGKPANLIVFNPEIEFVFDKHSMHSAGKNTPYHDWPLQGMVEYIFQEFRGSGR